MCSSRNTLKVFLSYIAHMNGTDKKRTTWLSLNEWMNEWMNEWISIKGIRKKVKTDWETLIEEIDLCPVEAVGLSAAERRLGAGHQQGEPLPLLATLYHLPGAVERE